MNQPHGRMAGNAVEVDEIGRHTEGNGPNDLVEPVHRALGRAARFHRSGANRPPPPEIACSN